MDNENTQETPETTPGYEEIVRIQERMAYNAILKNQEILTAVMDALETLCDKVDNLEATMCTASYDAETETINLTTTTTQQQEISE